MALHAKSPLSTMDTINVLLPKRNDGEKRYNQRGRADPRRGFYMTHLGQTTKSWEWPIGVLLYPPSNQTRDSCRVCLTTVAKFAPVKLTNRSPLVSTVIRWHHQPSLDHAHMRAIAPPGWGRQKRWEKELFSASALVSHLFSPLFWPNGSSVRTSWTIWCFYSISTVVCLQIWKKSCV